MKYKVCHLAVTDIPMHAVTSTIQTGLSSKRCKMALCWAICRTMGQKVKSIVTHVCRCSYLRFSVSPISLFFLQFRWNCYIRLFIEFKPCYPNMRHRYWYVTHNVESQLAAWHILTTIMKSLHDSLQSSDSLTLLFTAWMLMVRPILTRDS